MADTVTIRKRALGPGETAFECEVWASTTGKVLLNHKPLFRVIVIKDAYDAVDASWNIPAGATLSALVSANFGVTEV